MLDNEPTSTGTGNTGTDNHMDGADPTATPAARPRRRRAASRPAGPPAPVAESPAVETPAEGRPSVTAAPPQAELTADPGEPVAERPKRRRTSKKAAVAAETAPPAGSAETSPPAGRTEAPAVEASADAADPALAAEPVEAPTKPSRRSRKKTAVAHVTPAEAVKRVDIGDATGSMTTSDEVAADGGEDGGGDEAARAASAAARFQPPGMLFRAPDPAEAPTTARSARADDHAAADAATDRSGADSTGADRGGADSRGADSGAVAGATGGVVNGDGDDDSEDGRPRRRRRGGRGRSRRGRGGSADDAAEDAAESPSGGDDGVGDDDAGHAASSQAASSGAASRGAASSGEDRATGEPSEDRGDEEENGELGGTRRRRRRRRRGGGEDTGELGGDDPPNTVVRVREPRKTAKKSAGEPAGDDGVRSIRGSTRLEAKRQRRRDGREAGRRRPSIITEAEFLARREAVDRVMVVRQAGERIQIAVLEDGVLVEHYVASASSGGMVGNVYLGRVQNVLPSMEAAFVDVGKGRNAVLYAGEVNWDAAGLDGQPKRIEQALKSGDPVLAQITKDPIAHKGARLTSQVSLAGRYLVYVPRGSMTGISRKLPDTERARLKSILKKVVPEDAGVIVRTAAEGASEEEISRDVARLSAQWADIEKKARTASAPSLLYGEPDLTIRVVRDIFNEDFARLIVSGEDAWDVLDAYVGHVAPDLKDRLSRWTSEEDVFVAHRIDEQLAKALDRKVWLPSGGYLVIDRTEAMMVVDVNTGKFTGAGGNLEETVTKNNLEAAEEIVRQLRLRDLGGIIVIDFIDMVLEGNRDLVLRRLVECLGRDRTKHQVAEVTSLGLVQMTRKRVGQGLFEAFSETCECCNGLGVHMRTEPLEQRSEASQAAPERKTSGRGGRSGGDAKPGDGPKPADRKPAETGPTSQKPGDGPKPGDSPVAVEDPVEPRAEPPGAEPPGAEAPGADPVEPAAEPALAEETPAPAPARRRRRSARSV